MMEEREEQESGESARSKNDPNISATARLTMGPFISLVSKLNASTFRAFPFSFYSLLRAHIRATDKPARHEGTGTAAL